MKLQSLQNPAATAESPLVAACTQCGTSVVSVCASGRHWQRKSLPLITTLHDDVEALAEQCLLVVLQTHQCRVSAVLCRCPCRCKAATLLQQAVPGGSMATAQAHMQGAAAPAGCGKSPALSVLQGGLVRRRFKSWRLALAAVGFVAHACRLHTHITPPLDPYRTS
jgi:hypothetical protein